MPSQPSEKSSNHDHHFRTKSQTISSKAVVQPTCSVMNPPRPEQPGPPLVHNRTGSFSGFPWLSTNLPVRVVRGKYQRRARKHLSVSPALRHHAIFGADWQRKTQADRENNRRVCACEQWQRTSRKCADPHPRASRSRSTCRNPPQGRLAAT